MREVRWKWLVPAVVGQSPCLAAQSAIGQQVCSHLLAIILVFALVVATREVVAVAAAVAVVPAMVVAVVLALEVEWLPVLCVAWQQLQVLLQLGVVPPPQ